VRIDHDLCSGTRNCQHRYSEIFVVDHGKAWLRSGIDWTDVDVSRLRDAEDGCPWGAIEVEIPPGSAPVDHEAASDASAGQQ
jgi:ferredoxin